jgi:integral membrane protein
VGRLRLVGLMEGTSFLLLLGVAMPLKYLAGVPAAVLIVGWAHGVLFMLYVAVSAHAAYDRRWPASRTALALGASVVPAGTFLLDPSLRREEKAIREGESWPGR